MKLTDELLTLALQDMEKSMLLELPGQEQLNHVFSKRFERRMEKIIRRGPLQWEMIRCARKAAVFVLIAAAVTVTTVMSVSALRTRFFAMLSDAYQKYSAIYFQPAESRASSQIVPSFERYLIHTLPSGYRLTGHFSDEGLKINDMEFENSDKNRISFHQEDISTANFNVNTEGAELQEILINGAKAYYYENKRIRTIVWHNDRYAFLLSADAASELDKQEIIRIAESAAPQE